MTGSVAGQITGDEIISELIRNADAGWFKVRYTVLVPCIFNVYLHPRDYDLIKPIAELIREEAVRALKEHLSDLNKPRTARPFGKRFGSASEPRPEYKILEKQWVIQFHGDQEERLRPGEIEIYSVLGSARPKDFGAGAMTTFITRHPAGDSMTVAGNGGAARDQLPARPVFARVRYQDAGMDKTFVMNSEEIVIGRGGKAVWVDLKLDTMPDVSREHCRIRRDAETGRFTIEDASQFGTAVNGKPVGSGAAELPKRATISLAGVLDLQWEAA